MNDTFNEQKEKLVAINQEISLLRQQVNYLLRNEKALGLLDLDVLMNRTHTIYDLLCAVNLGNDADDEDLELDPEALAGLFGVSQEQPEDLPAEAPVEMPSEEVAPMEEPIEEPAEEPAEEPLQEPQPTEESAEEPIEEIAEEPAEEPVEEPMEQQPNEKAPGDEYGFFFRFEEAEPEEIRPIVTEDGKVVHFVDEVSEEDIPARDMMDGDSIVRDNPFEMPRMEDGTDDDADFELSNGETLGESLMQEDRSLAAKLQQTPGRDLKSVIGINDKFLFVNELFGGSMEKYNKSIENLNDLKTLNGAMIYLNELKIELQWNSSNEAYQKLADLVSHKFE